MQVTVEGVIHSDVCEAGETYTVEWTPQLRGLVRSGILKVVEWHHPTFPVEVTDHADHVHVADEVPDLEDDSTTKPARRPRMTKPADDA